MSWFTVDHWGQPLQAATTSGAITRIAYDANGMADTVVHSTGGVDVATYSGPLVTMTQPAGGPATLYTYGVFSQLATISGSGQPTVTNYLNAANGRVDSLRVNNLARTAIYYNARQRDTLVVDPEGHTIKYHYGSTTGNVDSTLVGDTTTALASNRYTKKLFDGYGRDSVVRASGAPGGVIVYDMLNRATQLYDSVGGASIAIAYDPVYPVRVQDQRGQVFRKDRQRSRMGDQSVRST